MLIPNPANGKNLSNPFISKKYNNAIDFVERLSLPVMLTNCSTKALIDGAYYGVIQTLDKKSVALLDLPSGYCCSRFKDIQGNDIVEFNNLITKNAFLIRLQKAYKRYKTKIEKVVQKVNDEYLENNEGIYINPPTHESIKYLKNKINEEQTLWFKKIK